mmetsp:Transcript_793/g.1671  ORF Transcript_793/g.1671 Transcript_793/m.1671 type:complete len:257 (-) Transcript_793:538-1308(-)
MEDLQPEHQHGQGVRGPRRAPRRDGRTEFSNESFCRQDILGRFADIECRQPCLSFGKIDAQWNQGLRGEARPSGRCDRVPQRQVGSKNHRSRRSRASRTILCLSVEAPADNGRRWVVAFAAQGPLRRPLHGHCLQAGRDTHNVVVGKPRKVPVSGRDPAPAADPSSGGGTGRGRRAASRPPAAASTRSTGSGPRSRGQNSQGLCRNRSRVRGQDGDQGIPSNRCGGGRVGRPGEEQGWNRARKRFDVVATVVHDSF